ncbi:hypothetical protein V502_05760 [Pseudogymnoascus sp. VKM F-4520 (FW-2644)]|nr:hypothetical protein V502_05760 [Pseudogymnoascus sp. VKM F-4520 (FW-2644)]
MPPQTRAARINPPAGRVYESPRLPPQQVKFQPRRQKVYGRHSLGGAKRKKQETLTQIGFVNPLTDKEIDEEIEAYEREEKTRNKRRKTLTPSSKFYTQTLTQLDFDSTPKVECRDTEDEDEDGDDVEDEDEEEQNQEQNQADTEVDERTEHVSESPVPPRRRSKRGGIITVRCIKVEPEGSRSPSPSPQNPTIPPYEPVSSQATITKPSPSQATTSMPPPKTPTRKRTLEVPSSLSPATPLSSQSIAHSLRTHDQRSPLKPRSGNLSRLTSPIPSSPSKLSLPHQSQISTQAITQDSPLSRVPDSSPFRPRHVTQSTQSPSAQVLSEFTAASTPTPPPPRRVGKTEIADSDADSDADLADEDEDDEDDEDDGLAPLPPRAQPPVQVPSSPDTAPRRRWAVTSSSPPRRPVLAVKETVLGSEGDDLGSQWTRSQLLPGSLGMDSLLALPPGFGDGEWDE